MKWIKRLKLKQLNLLVILAETGNLSETARKTNMTQPALSRWLKELEDDIGHELFVRQPKGLSVTAAGNILLMHARRILVEAARAQQDLDDVAAGQSRTLAIGMSPAAAPKFAPETLMQFLKAYPNVRLDIQESTMDNLTSRLKCGELDLIIGRLDNYTPQNGMRSELLYQDPIRIVARTQHPLAGKKSLNWEDLEGYEWIVWPSGTPIKSRLDNALTASGKKPPVYRVKSTSQVANLWLLQRSNMLSVASKGVAEHFCSRGLLTELDIELGIVDGAVGMIWDEQVQPDDLLDTLIECCRQAVCPLSED